MPPKLGTVQGGEGFMYYKLFRDMQIRYTQDREKWYCKKSGMLKVSTLPFMCTHLRTKKGIWAPWSLQTLFICPMAPLKFLTWNVQGMNKIKRMATFSFLKKQQADIIVLVETHIEGRLKLALKRPWIRWAYHSVYTTHSRGVSRSKIHPFWAPGFWVELHD